MRNTDRSLDIGSRRLAGDGCRDSLDAANGVWYVIRFKVEIIIVTLSQTGMDEKDGNKTERSGKVHNSCKRAAAKPCPKVGGVVMMLVMNFWKDEEEYGQLISYLPYPQ